MTQRVKAHASGRAGKPSRGRSDQGMMTMLMVNGDPSVALEGVALPADAQVAIVSTRAGTMEEIKRSGRTRFGTTRTVYADAPPTTATRLVMDRTAFEPDARSLALLEGVRIAREDLRAAGGAYDLDQVRTLMGGVTRQAVEKRVQEGSLLAVPGPSNRRSFPTLQFNGDGTLVAGLREVREALPTRNAWTILNFLAQPDDRLDGRKPIDLLKAAEIKLVLEAARRVGQQGA